MSNDPKINGKDFDFVFRTHSVDAWWMNLESLLIPV